jgi:hypothetical protein
MTEYIFHWDIHQLLLKCPKLLEMKRHSWPLQKNKLAFIGLPSWREAPVFCYFSTHTKSG